MAAINYDLVRWSLKKWLFVIVGLMALHLVLLWQLSGPPPVVAPPLPATPRVAMAAPQQVSADNLVLLQDPLLFATAHPQGFSGAAWVKKPQRNYALQMRLPSPTFLDAAGARALFKEELPTPALMGTHIPRARVTPEIGGSAGTFPSASEMRIEGALAARPLAREVKLPIQQHNDALENTVVEAGVAPDGFVLSARVINASGSRKADQDALGITRSLRFKPTKAAGQEQTGENLTWGKLIFEWFALDLAGTNALPK